MTKVLVNLVCGPHTKYYQIWRRGIEYAFEKIDYHINIYCPPYADIYDDARVTCFKDFGVEEPLIENEYKCPYTYWDRLIVDPTGYDVVHFSQLDWYPIAKFDSLVQRAAGDVVVVPDYPNYYYLVEPSGNLVPRFWEGCCFISSKILLEANTALARSGHNNNHRITIFKEGNELGNKYKHMLANLGLIGSGCQHALLNDIFTNQQPWETLLETYLYIYLNGYTIETHNSAIHLCGIEKPLIKSDDINKMIGHYRANKNGYYRHHVYNIVIANALSGDISPKLFGDLSRQLINNDRDKAEVLAYLSGLYKAGWLNTTIIGDLLLEVDCNYAI